MKMGQRKKRPNKWVAFAWTLQRMDDKQISQRGVVVEEKGNLLSIKGLNKKEKVIQLASYCVKMLEDGYLGNGVESISDILL